MVTFEEIKKIVDQVTYKPDWLINAHQDAGGRPYIQISVGLNSDATISPFTGERQAWKSGKTYLSEHMCVQEIVGACFGLIRSAEEHEMKEWFKYKTASIYNPHLCPDALVAFAKKKVNLCLRENAMSMDESSKETRSLPGLFKFEDLDFNEPLNDWTDRCKISPTIYAIRQWRSSMGWRYWIEYRGVRSKMFDKDNLDEFVDELNSAVFAASVQ